MPVRRSDAVGKRRGARGNSRVERRAVDANVGDANGRTQRSCWHHESWSRHLREGEMQVRQLCARHVDRHSMTAGVTRFGSRRWRGVQIGCYIVIPVGFGQWRVVIPVLMRGRTMVMGRMVVSGVLMNVQRRHDTRYGRKNRNEERCQKALHSDESMGGAVAGQPHAYELSRLAAACMASKSGRRHLSRSSWHDRRLRRESACFAALRAHSAARSFLGNERSESCSHS